MKFMGWDQAGLDMADMFDLEVIYEMMKDRAGADAEDELS